MGRTNVSGGTSDLNVFAQLEEPTKKDGIWIKTEESKYKYDGIILTDIIPNEYIKVPDMSFASSDNPMESAVVNKNIYIFQYTNAWKYNNLTNKRTNLSNIPYPFHSGCTVAVGANIYLFGSSVSSGSTNYYKYAYKYDISNDTYTRITNIPYDFYWGSAVAIDTDVYLFGGNSATIAYKYDTLTNTYTQLTNIPYNFSQGSAVAIGTDVYLLGSYRLNYKKYTYKYNTITDSYTKLTDIPYEFYEGSAVAIGTDVYLFGSEKSDYRQSTYKYSTITNSYTKLTNIPRVFYKGTAASIGTNIYLFGGYNNSSSIVNTYSYYVSTQNNYIYIISGIITIILNKTLQTNISKAYIYKDDKIQEYPCYYGDGTKWNLIN